MPLSLASMAHSLLAALLIAAVVDLRTRRIPNPSIVAGLACAAFVHALSLGTSTAPLAGPSWWSPLAGFTAGLLLMLPLHLLRAMGAGDVKLMAMVGAFIGAPAVLGATLYTLLAGGVLSLLSCSAGAWLHKPLPTSASSSPTGRCAPPTARARALHRSRPPPPACRMRVAIALGTGAALVWPLGA